MPAAWSFGFVVLSVGDVETFDSEWSMLVALFWVSSVVGSVWVGDALGSSSVTAGSAIERDISSFSMGPADAEGFDCEAVKVAVSFSAVVFSAQTFVLAEQLLVLVIFPLGGT